MVHKDPGTLNNQDDSLTNFQPEVSRDMFGTCAFSQSNEDGHRRRFVKKLGMGEQERIWMDFENFWKKQDTLFLSGLPSFAYKVFSGESLVELHIFLPKKLFAPGGWRRLWWYGFLAILEVPENHGKSQRWKFIGPGTRLNLYHQTTQLPATLREVRSSALECQSCFTWTQRQYGQLHLWR